MDGTVDNFIYESDENSSDTYSDSYNEEAMERALFKFFGD